LRTEVRPVRRRKRRGKRVAYLVLVYAAAVLTTVIVLAPFAWLLISSVASPVDLLARPLEWIPSHISVSYTI
jgi:multiple sugar transport system permease protein